MSGRSAAIVLAAGRGKRMNSKVHKQYLLLREKPVLYYSLKAFEDCPFIEEIVLVTGEEEINYCKKEIVEKYGFCKVRSIVPGGKERYHSVYEGLRALKETEYVYIHDGARPFVDQEMLLRARKAVEEHQACVVGMPVKDTIKLSDENQNAVETPERSRVWMVQTPQVFFYPLITQAYKKLIDGNIQNVTDDAMVLEVMEKRQVKLVEGSYRNIKITTPEDLLIAESFCQSP